MITVLSLFKISLLQFIFGKVHLAMVAYFVISIINSMAQAYAKREHEKMLHSLLSSLDKSQDNIVHKHKYSMT